MSPDKARDPRTDTIEPIHRPVLVLPVGCRSARHRPACSPLCAFGVAMLAALLGVSGRPAMAQVALEEEPISYFSDATKDPVSQLQERIDAGEVTLERGSQGYLASLLKNLNVPPSSQTLVFSKTSFQLRRISPVTPRAVYFSDDVYVGWVRGGDVLELSAVDPEKGAIFYTLSQTEERPRLVRRTHDCLQCHSSNLTQGVPGHLVRSVRTAPDGRPILRAGTFLTDHTSPLAERWGGWYVTGEHGEQRHLGNLLSDAERGTPLGGRTGANVTDLTDYFDTSPYLTDDSDLVALLVLEHQSQAQNLITRASYLTRVALEDQRVVSEMLGEETSHLSPSTKRRLHSAVQPLVDYLLFVDEATFDEPVRGTSTFAADFVARGERDRHGRSLRQFDLKTRLFAYPLSYVIYSEAFGALPDAAKESVYSRLWSVLSGAVTDPKYQHLTAATRRAIVEIVSETKYDLPDEWYLAATAQDDPSTGSGVSTTQATSRSSSPEPEQDGLPRQANF